MNNRQRQTGICGNRRCFFYDFDRRKNSVEKKAAAVTRPDNGSYSSPKDSTEQKTNPLEKRGGVPMIGIGKLLDEVGERLQKKTHLRFVTTGWEKRIGIVIDDTASRWQLTISKGGVSAGIWEEQSADLIVRGGEHQMEMLFGGDELVYALAKQQVKIVGTLRDQLKLDAILRLTCK